MQAGGRAGARAASLRPLPVVALLVEAAQQGHLDGGVQRHVILNSVESTQHKVEDAHSVAQPLGQLLDHHGKAAQRMGSAGGGWGGAGGKRAGPTLSQMCMQLQAVTCIRCLMKAIVYATQQVTPREQSTEREEHLRETRFSMS